MIGSIALMLLGAAAAATPCESLASLKLDKATITSAQMVPEGPAPARGGGRGARRRASAPAASPPPAAGDDSRRTAACSSCSSPRPIR